MKRYESNVFYRDGEISCDYIIAVADLEVFVLYIVAGPDATPEFVERVRSIRDTALDFSSEAGDGFTALGWYNALVAIGEAGYELCNTFEWDADECHGLTVEQRMTVPF